MNACIVDGRSAKIATNESNADSIAIRDELRETLSNLSHNDNLLFPRLVALGSFSLPYNYESPWNRYGVAKSRIISFRGCADELLNGDNVLATQQRNR